MTEDPFYNILEGSEYVDWIDFLAAVGDDSLIMLKALILGEQSERKVRKLGVTR